MKMIDTGIYYCCRHFRKYLKCTVMFVRFPFSLIYHFSQFKQKQTNTTQKKQTTTCNMSCSPPVYVVSFHKYFMGKKYEIPPEEAELYTVNIQLMQPVTWHVAVLTSQALFQQREKVLGESSCLNTEVILVFL